MDSKTISGTLPAHRFNVIASLTIAVFALLFVCYGYYDYQTVLGNGRRAAEQIAEHTALVMEGTLDSTQQLIHAMEFLIQATSSQETSDSAAIERNLLHLKSRNPHIMDLLIISSDGVIQQWTGKGRPPDIRDRDYFTFHAPEAASDWYVGTPLLSKVHQGQWFFAVSEAVRDDRGKLICVLAAIVDVAILRERMGNKLAIPGSTEVLLGNDGTIYARTPEHELHVGKKVPLESEFETLTPENPLLTVVRVSRLDQMRRVIAFRRLSHYPMIAAGSIMVDELLVEWRRRIGLVAMLWLLLSAGIVWITIRANAINRLHIQLANIDCLTGIRNRRALMSMASQLERSQSNAGSLSLLMIDVDHFKSLNDCFGHVVGDEILRQVADILRTQVRATDIVGRYGGEEFLVLMPDTGPEGALHVANNLCKTVTAKIVKPVQVTISIGCATTSENESTLEKTLVRADQALYEAKTSGRNCVKTA